LRKFPNSFVDLKSVKKLNLDFNHFEKIPSSIWGLTNLKKLRLRKNPLDNESEEISKNSIQTILEFCRKRATLHIFISHAVADFEPYNVEALSDYLENQDEIYRVFFCERDMVGNITRSMQDNLMKSHLVLLIATKNSIYSSSDCNFEIDLAKKHGINIIPVKGGDIEWEELEKLGLKRTLGTEFNFDNFKGVCQNIYDYIKKFKREIDLHDKEKDVVQQRLLELKDIFGIVINSNEFKHNFMKHYDQINNIFSYKKKSWKDKINFLSELFQKLNSI
ncbi:MAG: toll/interleukin-1 receptor domain-containing protein, partial [Candidatus Lokiarchaeota archaeon]|nr:toll/interleukin-1 receptor domain-containing protein [Candidatus Lokiarchaeota archaeon]